MIKKAGFKEFALWLIGNRQRFTIEGTSMEPLLRENDQVLMAKKREYFLGDIVILKHPIQTDLILIKQITVVQSDEKYEVRGLHQQESSDSRTFGWIEKKQILGSVMSVF